MNGTTLLSYNFKGGTGKTTLTAMTAYCMNRSRNINKILLVDFDPQANLTSVMQQTYHVNKNPQKSISDGLRDVDLKNCRISLTDKIDLIPADFELNDWITTISNLAEKTRWSILRDALFKIKSEYDYVLIDVPPTLNDIVRNAIVAADGISVVLQTQRLAYDSALQTVKQLINMRSKFGAKFAFLGIILYLRKTNTRTDKRIAQDAIDTFSGNVYKNAIKYHERVNVFTDEGIKNIDYWDHRSIGMYQRLTNEMIERSERMIK